MFGNIIRVAGMHTGGLAVLLALTLRSLPDYARLLTLSLSLYSPITDQNTYLYITIPINDPRTPGGLAAL